MSTRVAERPAARTAPAVRDRVLRAAADRYAWVDYAKGITILLVVYGHTLNGMAAKLPELPAGFQYASAGAFSTLIPLFFFLAGLFVERSCDKRGPARFLGQRTVRLAYPYVIWSLAQGAAEILFSAHSRHGTTVTTLLAIPYEPLEQFWFLYTLFLMYPAYVLSRPLGRAAKLALGAAAVALFLRPIDVAAFTLDQFSLHLVFFAGGVALAPYLLGQRALRMPRWTTLCLTAAFAAVSVHVLRHNVDPVTALDTHVQHRNYYLVMASLGCAAVLGWAQWLAASGRAPLLRVLGAYSLQIYVAHMFFSVGARIAAAHLLRGHDPLLAFGGAIAAGVAGPIALCMAMQRLRLPSLFEPVRPLY